MRSCVPLLDSVLNTHKKHIISRVMPMKKNKLFIAAVLALCLTACGSKIGKNESAVQTSAPEQTTTAAEEANATMTDTPEPEPVITTVEDITIKAEEAAFAEYSETAEAEEQELTEGLTAVTAETEEARSGFSGEGYVTGLDPEHGMKFSFDLPESQYYNITVTIASDEESLCKATINDETVGEFKVGKSEGFTIVTFSNLKLEKGAAVLGISVTSGKAELDCVSIASSTEIRDLDLTLKKFALSNKEADFGTQALYEYLCKGSGERILTGQHDTAGTMTETLRIYELTGHYPAIRFGDLMPVTQEMTISEIELEYAEKWAAEGGLVSYMWHWADPVGREKYYADETDFDLSKAVTEEDIAGLDIEEIEKLHADGKISDECLALVKDIDKVSEALTELRDSGITVIWRPLHEASNGYFWWGHDADSYKWLWKLLYQRQTSYHKLGNLIWVWSAQNSGWYVGDDMCDMISADIYDKGNLSGHVERLVFLKKISSSKPIVMSECGTTPSIQQLANEHAFWGFIGQWGGSFLMNSDSSLNEEYNKPSDLISFYSNDLTVTREELPDLTERAKELKDEAEKQAEDNKDDNKDKDKDDSKDEDTDSETASEEDKPASESESDS